MNMKAQIVGLAVFGLIISVFFQNCSRPVSFQEATTMDFSSLSVSGLLINNDAPYTNNSVVSLSLDVGNAAEMYVTNSPDCSSGGAWVPATEQLGWELGSTNSEVAVYAKFRSTYQKESLCMSDSILHDNIAPVMALQGALAPKTNQVASAINLSSSDSGSGIEKVFCPSSIAACGNSVSVANTSDGPKSLSFYAVDKAGNRSPDLMVSYLVDRTPPLLTLNAKPPAKTSAQTANFVFSATDTYSSVVTFKCQMNGGAYVACPANYSISGLNDGDYSVNVVAVDDLGNTSAPQTAAWTVSRKLPNVIITKLPPPNTNQKGSFEFSGTDQFGTVLTQFQCSLNGGPWNACSSPYDLSVAALVNPGVNRFKVRGTDSGGLVSGEEERLWSYDTFAPSISLASKPALFTKKASESAVVSVLNSESVELEFKLDGVIVSTSVPLSYTFSPTEAPHVIAVVATDKAGNKSALSYNFVSDYTIPTLSFPDSLYPNLPTPTSSSVLKFAVQAQDTNKEPGNNLSTYYSLNDLGNSVTATDNFILFASPLNLASIKNGSHQIKFTVKDAAGNENTSYVSNSFLVDLLPPVISYLSQPPANVRPGTALLINYLVQDNDSGLLSTKCKLTRNGIFEFDQDCVSAFMYTYLSPLEGNFIYTITATDKVGNTSQKSVSWSAVEEFKSMTKTFNVSAQTNSKVDILFVMDNSRTMKDENTRIAEAFSSFTDNLAGIDYRIAITTTDVALGGELHPMIYNGITLPYIQKSTPDGILFLQGGLQVKTNQSGSETALSTIQDFIDRSKIAATSENAFYRPEAVLATVIITDDDEAEHAGYQSALPFLADLERKLPNKIYINHSSIVLPNDEACKAAQGINYGVTYFEASVLTGGSNVSICAPDYGNQLKEFATKIIARVSEQTLECNPIDQNRDGTIDISITYATSTGPVALAPSSYSVLGNRVRFASPLTNLGDYNISFFCVK